MKTGRSVLNKKMLIALGFAYTAALATSNTGLADCGGLFLLHMSDKQFSAKACSVRDSFEVENFKVNGAFYHTAIQGRYTDKWNIKGLSRSNIVSAGFETHYKFLTLDATVNSLPMVASTLSAHREDSLFRVNAGFAIGSIDLGNISWIPDKSTEMVGTISVDWESHFLYRHLSAESKFKKHYINLSLAHLKTTPHNPDKNYYIRDSLSAIILGTQYKYDFGSSQLEAGYSFADADMTLYGIYHNEESRKRFMYTPIDATLHLAYAKWDYDALKTHLGYAYLSGKLKSNPNRFYETLAPNRALSASVIKGLSFAFLQKAFRIDASLNAFGILGGATYHWTLGNRYQFEPNVGLDFFGTSGDINIDTKTETTKAFGTSNSYYESKVRKLNSVGNILSLGCRMHRKGTVNISLDYGITQIIPFYIDYRDLNANEKQEEQQSSSTNNGSGGKGSNKGNSKKTEKEVSKDKSGALKRNASALLFRNGFATHLGVSVKF